MNIESLDPSIEKEKILDVTTIEPRLKHPTIFKYFDQLNPGDYFIIHNDHDPKPVYYQLLGERGNIFSFDYLSKGPEDWLIKIQKKATILQEAPANNQAVIPENEQKKAAFFASRGKEYSCHNGIDKNTIETSHNISSLKENTLLNDSIILNYDKWPLGFLCDFIKYTEHPYFREQAPALGELCNIILDKHKQQHPTLASLKIFQDQLLATLLFHVNQEQKVVFELTRKAEGLIKEKAATAAEEHHLLLLLSQLQTSCTLKKQAHQTLAQLLENIRKQTNNFLTPTDACESFIYYYERLRQFDLRLSRYLHLENTILLPKINTWF